MDQGCGSSFVVCLGSPSLRVVWELLVVVTWVDSRCSGRISSQVGDGFATLRRIMSKSVFGSVILPELFINMSRFAI